MAGMGVVRGAFDPAVEAAVRGSFLAVLHPEPLERLLADAVLVEMAPGSQVALAVPTRVGIMIEGLMRVYLAASTGRQLTLRYVHPPAAVGLASLVAPADAIVAEALSPVSLLRINGRTLMALAESEPAIGLALAHEAGDRLRESARELASYAFGSVKERLARHLLELAAESALGGLVVRASQQRLADAVGSVREVVGKMLAQLGADGLIGPTPAGIRLLDPTRLQVMARAAWA